MTLLNRKTRSAVTLATVAAVVPFATAAPVGAAPSRTADTSAHTHAAYLQSPDGLNLPASADPVIEPVTYDRFQWLLQQPGKLAILIGDPATDPTFDDRAQDVEAAAKAAGVKEIYWFNPNLSGNAQVGGKTEPNLDIRKPSGINVSSNPQANAQEIYGKAWLNLIGRHLGNGIKAEPVGENGGSATVTITNDATVVNDSGADAGKSTEVGNTSGGALFQYSGGTAPADVQESYFLIYDKDHKVGGANQKVVAWIDLTDEAASATTKAKVTTAVQTAGGAASLTAISEFEWWKSSNNAKQALQSTADTNGKDVPVLTDADNDPAEGGWRVHQLTYPELVYLLKTEKTKDAAILFGGTWCPNTRPVIGAINEQAQDNATTVFNFDTILDGGVVGGGNTGSNPLQVRGHSTYSRTVSGVTTDYPNYVPSNIYGDVVDTYLKNLETQYDKTKGGGQAITYLPGGNTAAPLVTTKKLQVPYLIGYKGNDAGNGVTRQWLWKKADGTYTEYMSSWWWTNPKPNQLNISTIPLATSTAPAAPIWSKINQWLGQTTADTDPSTFLPNTTVFTDAAEYLVDADTATVNTTTGAATSGGASPISISPSALASALQALGASAPSTLEAARTAWLADKANANLKTVVGAWGIVATRKSRIITVWGEKGNPNSLIGGLQAVKDVGRFFDGLPGGVVSTRKVTAGDVVAGSAVPIAIEIANDFDRKPTGAVTLVVKQGGAPVATQSAAVADGKASFSVPGLTAGSYDFTLSYETDSQLAGFSERGSFTVGAASAQGGQAQNPGGSTGTPQQTGSTTPTVVKPIAAIKLAGTISKAPTSKKPGKYLIKVTPAAGRAAASGKVTITLKKGKAKKKLTGTLVNGVVKVTVPKLAKGTWKVTVAWAGDKNHLAATVKGASIKVKK